MMDTLTSTLMILLGFALRLAVPLLITAVVVFFLRRLDARWQAEAEREQKRLVNGDASCLKEQGISFAAMKARMAAGERPCWQMRRLPNGHLREECLGCEYFLEAPAPAPRAKHAHV